MNYCHVEGFIELLQKANFISWLIENFIFLALASVQKTAVLIYILVAAIKVSRLS